MSDKKNPDSAGAVEVPEEELSETELNKVAGGTHTTTPGHKKQPTSPSDGAPGGERGKIIDWLGSLE